MKITFAAILFGVITFLAAGTATARDGLKLVPLKGTKIKLVSNGRSATIDLDDALSGNSSMPGEPPHIYKVLFTAEKGGYLFLVANVRSRSPISDKNAPCGGDSPQSMLWIKIDKKLKDPQFENEIYASCSYNLYDSKVKITKSGVTLKIGGKNPKELIYSNYEPEKGFVLGELFAKPSMN